MPRICLGASRHTTILQSCLSGLLGGAGGGDAAGGDAAEAAGTLRELEGILGQLPDTSSP